MVVAVVAVSEVAVGVVVSWGGSSSLLIRINAFLVPYFIYFLDFLKDVMDRPMDLLMDRWTDGPKDRQTDRPFSPDAHPKIDSSQELHNKDLQLPTHFFCLGALHDCHSSVSCSFK